MYGSDMVGEKSGPNAKIISNDNRHLNKEGNYNAQICLDMYGSTIVGERLGPNDQIICQDKRHTTQKGNDTAPIFSVGHSNQIIEGAFLEYVWINF